jgi:thioredoxin-related protein
MLGKVLSKMNIEVEDINANENLELVDKYEVCTTPTLVFLDENNEEVSKIVGPTTQSKIQEVLDNNGFVS